MTDRPGGRDALGASERLEARLEELARSVEALARRVSALESAMGAGEPSVERSAPPVRRGDPTDRVEGEAASAAPTATPTPSEEAAAGWSGLALVGRTLMVLGGAYLIRALTEGGAVPAVAGLLLGIAYAFVWLIYADRAAAAGRRRSAAFHGASFALIAEPLAWEAAGRFGAVGAAGGALGVALFTACALGVAWWRRLRAVAWIAVLGAIFSAWALMASIAPMTPALAVLVAAVVAADWLAVSRGWRWLPWPAAAAADLTLAVLAVEAIFGRPEELAAIPGLAWVLLALFLGSAGSTVARALAERGGRWRPRWFELLQVPTAVVVGYAGAWGIVRAQGAAGLIGPGGALGLGLGSAVAALACYGTAYSLLEHRPQRRPAFLVLSGLGMVLVLGASGLLLGPVGLAVLWSVLAVVGGWVCGRRRTVTLGLHGFGFALLAAVASGLLVDAAHAFAGAPDGAWPQLSAVSVVVLVALAVAASLRLPTDSPFWGRAARVPKLLLLAALVWAAGGTVLAVTLPALPAGPDGPALVAAVRTTFVALVALALGWVSRFDRFREARWLVYAVLAAGAVKLLAEDLLLGRPAELFVALAVYGGALILAPRLARG